MCTYKQNLIIIIMLLLFIWSLFKGNKIKQCCKSISNFSKTLTRLNKRNIIFMIPKICGKNTNMFTFILISIYYREYILTIPVKQKHIFNNKIYFLYVSIIYSHCFLMHIIPRQWKRNKLFLVFLVFFLIYFPLTTKYEYAASIQT